MSSASNSRNVQLQGLSIPYESEDFAGSYEDLNDSGLLNTNWSELIWAALTVGRPNRQYVFRQSESSAYEALFRMSLVRMCLEQSGPNGRRFYRTDAFKTLDPSEKGAVTYFLGLAVAKLFAAKLLDTPWLLHFDVFRPQLNAVLSGRSRPDLVGQILGTGEWIGLECKGRSSVPDQKAKLKAKQQARRLRSIDGAAPIMNIGSFAFFQADTLNFYWVDPPPEEPRQSSIEIQVKDDAWQHYYAPILALFRSSSAQIEVTDTEHILELKDADVQIAVLNTVIRLLEQREWEGARRAAMEVFEVFAASGFQRDGVRVVAGPSWRERYSKYES